MRHCDRQTLAASIAAHLTYRQAVTEPDLSWKKQDVFDILDDLVTLARDGDTTGVNALDKLMRAGGTAYKWSVWGSRRDDGRLRTLIANLAMKQRPEQDEK